VIFVDTGAWYARYVSEDVDYIKAVTWFANPADLLVTADYVVDELLTLLQMRGYSQTAFAVGDRLPSANVCRLEYVQPHDIHQAWSMFS
jgi:predicted nucleic acid-binding protein